MASQPAESSLGSPLQFSATGLPHWLSLDPSSGLISGTINGGNDQESPFQVTVQAIDPLGTVASGSFTWYVHRTYISIADPYGSSSFGPLRNTFGDTVSLPRLSGTSSSGRGKLLRFRLACGSNLRSV